VTITWSQSLREQAANRPHDVAVVDGERILTWAELDALADGIAAGLAAHGIAPGERVVSLLENRADLVALAVAAQRAGIVLAPLNPVVTEFEVTSRCAAISPALIIAEASTAAAASGAGVEIIDVDSADWRALAATPPTTEVIADPEDTAQLLFSAGTNGEPRAAMLSYRAIGANLEQLAALPKAVLTPKDRVLVVLPLFHAYALNAVVGAALKFGAALVLQRRFETTGSLATIKEHRVTVVPAVPPIYLHWITEPGLAKALKGVRLFLSGSAPLPPAVQEQFSTITGHVVWQGYGMTEAAPVLTSTIVNEIPDPGSVGTALPGVELRLVDEEGTDPDEGDLGEVWVRSPSLFSGYWPDGTNGPDPDGWFGTGDLGVLDEAGALHLVGRVRDLVNVGGFKVYPREVEEALESHPSVLEAAVVGVPHPLTGETVKAWVVLRPGEQATPVAILDHAATRLARFKRPAILEIVDELPRATTGKVARRKLRDSTS
jgi:long-chain acyl-CoA synthetase